MKKNKEKRRPMTFRSIAVRFICLTLALWTAAMGLLTWAAAEDMYTKLGDHALRMASGTRGTLERHIDPAESGLYMVRSLIFPYYHLEPLLPIMAEPSSKNWLQNWRAYGYNGTYGYEAAVVHRDSEDNVLVRTGSYLTVPYTSENRWYTGNIDAQGTCFIALDDLPGGRELFDGYTADFPAMTTGFCRSLYRMSGYFVNDRFYPVLIDEGTLPFESLADASNENVRRTYNNRDLRMGTLKWTRVLELDAPPEQELETIFAWDLGGYSPEPVPVTVGGTTFGSLVELADKAVDVFYEKNLCEAFIRRTAATANGSTIVVIRCRPLKYAAVRLIPAYLISLAPIGLVLWLILWKIYRNLTSPLLDLATSPATGREITPSAGWWEPYEIQKHLCEARQALTDTNTRLRQTETALDYAHHAEENRKQLISNLAHELKTPLSIIHSYAEGLQEGIAEDKKEQYLSVILEESERMDGLVLQMLDLSRLEAGKVRLTVEPVALLKLTRAVTNRFAPLLEEKELSLHYDIAEDLTVPADESRMEQVITNLVSNAVKYTPAGGSIRLRLYLFGGKAHFFIENTTPHLSDEALEKVWDSFYRADPSRTEPGTGLGLALVKGIVTLHRGECSVRNITVDGGIPAVEFGFTLPVD